MIIYFKRTYLYKKFLELWKTLFKKLLDLAYFQSTANIHTTAPPLLPFHTVTIFSKLKHLHSTDNHSQPQRILNSAHSHYNPVSHSSKVTSWPGFHMYLVLCYEWWLAITSLFQSVLATVWVQCWNLHEFLVETSE